MLIALMPSWMGMLIAVTAIVMDASAAVQDPTGETANLRSVVNAAESADWQRLRELVRDGDDPNQKQADGMTALHWAALQGELESSRHLIEAGAKVDAQNEYGVTPLSLAAEYGCSSVAKLLINSKANVNYRLPGRSTVLMIASRAGNAEIVQALIAAGADVNAKEQKGQTALMWAASEGHSEAVATLIAGGADVQARSSFGFTPMMFAARQGRIEVVKRLVQAGVDINQPIDPRRSGGRNPRKDMSPLMFAVENGHFELALKMVEWGADPNDQRSQFSPLHALTWVRKTKVGDNPDGDPPPRGSGRVHSLEFATRLVEAGADVNLQLKKGSGGRAKMSTRGATPFLMAARTADVPLMKLLLELGADPTITNAEGCNALMAAAGVGVTAVGEEPGTVDEVNTAIGLLLELGLDINAVDENGETAMHGAAYRNYPETVAFLAERGADPSVWDQPNRYGWTPVLIASGNRPGSFKPSPETIAALQAAMTAAGNDEGAE